jgi:hypothetical protein
MLSISSEISMNDFLVSRTALQGEHPSPSKHEDHIGDPSGFPGYWIQNPRPPAKRKPEMEIIKNKNPFSIDL